LLALEEAGRGDPDQAQMRLAAIAKFPMLDIEDEARHLAEKILAKKEIQIEYSEDALHIAIAAVNGMDPTYPCKIALTEVNLQVNISP
jgi:hypothetical protein